MAWTKLSLNCQSLPPIGQKPSTSTCSTILNKAQLCIPTSWLQPRLFHWQISKRNYHSGSTPEKTGRRKKNNLISLVNHRDGTWSNWNLVLPQTCGTVPFIMTKWLIYSCPGTNSLQTLCVQNESLNRTKQRKFPNPFTVPNFFWY